MLKNSKAFVVASLMALAIGCASTIPVDAGSSSSRSSFTISSSSKSFSGSSTYSKPSTPTLSPSTNSYSKPPAPSINGSSYSKPDVVSTPTTTTNTYSKPNTPIVPASNNGYSKPSNSTPSITSTVNNTYSKPDNSGNSISNNNYTKPNGISSPTTTSSQAPATYIAPSALAGGAAKSMSASSLKSYQAERANAKLPLAPINSTAVKEDPAYNSVKYSYGNIDNYMAKRTIILNSYQTQHPNIINYTHNMYPYYGSYDNSFLLGLVFGYLGSNASSNASWIYSHENDSWYPQWRADLNKQAQDNAELKTKLDNIDTEVARIKMQGNFISNKAIPDGVDGSIALAPEVMIAGDENNNSSNPHLFWLIISLLIGMLIIALLYFYIVGKR